MVEICEMGTTSTGSAAAKKPVVAQVYSERNRKTPKLSLNDVDGAMELCAHRDENGVDSGEKGETGCVSRQEIMEWCNGGLALHMTT